MKKPKPDNTVEEKKNGFYFPAWGIHVAKTTHLIEKTRRPFKKNGKAMVRITEREKRINVCKTLEDAKKHIKETHGIDVDKDIPPPKPDKQDEPGKTEKAKA